MFGTDSCKRSDVNGVWRTVATIRDLRQRGKLRETVFRKVARENAVRLLGLTP